MEIFTMEVPESWQKIEHRPFEGPMAQIAIGDNDTLIFSVGAHEPNLSENIAVVERSILQVVDFSAVDTTELNIVEDIHNFDPDRFRKNNIAWDTIDGHLTKIVFPINTGTGTTGIFIDSFSINGYKDVSKLILVGYNLKPQNEQQVLKSVKTIKFKKSR